MWPNQNLKLDITWPNDYLLVSADVLCCLFSFARTLAWWASYSSRLGYILEINASKLGSGRRDLFDTSFFLHVGHSLLPLRSAVIMQSWQKRCKHSFVVIVFFSMSRHIGHINSLCKLLGDTAISVLSVIASWGVLWSSYKLNSHVLFGAFTTSFAIFHRLAKPDVDCENQKPITLFIYGGTEAQTAYYKIDGFGFCCYCCF